jgi:hypothetical protein
MSFFLPLTVHQDANYARSFLYPGEHASVSVTALRDWIDSYFRGDKLKQYRMGQPRPTNDLAGEEGQYPGLMCVVPDSFDELVMDESKHMLLYLCEGYLCTSCAGMHGEKFICLHLLVLLVLELPVHSLSIFPVSFFSVSITLVEFTG